ncbi:MAG: cation:proton antiporter, partial [Coxiellaceae bacterium]|nr:cation:proton antiporter [Coxiellaceae bacterium]
AFSLNPRQLRRNLSPILALAIPGLLLSTGLIGLIVYWLTPIDLAAALLLGAILSATDPIAVIALFKTLGAPKRLTVLVEGESLFNDATSIVTAKLLFTVVIAGVLTTHDITHGVIDFFFEFFGGVLVGWIIALAIGFILGLVESDPEIEISLTTILAYATFLVAQNMFHVSGVMATVAAGLTLSGWGRAKISPSVHSYMEYFWQFLAYIANALIFLLVGLSVNMQSVFDSLGILFVVIIAMFVSRAVITYGLIPILGRFPGAIPISKEYQTAIFWGGLRGAIALAIVLSLQDFPYKELFTALVTGAVLFTLLVNGLTMERLMKWLRLDIPPLSDRLAREEGQLSATKHALAGIPELQQG